MESVIIKRRRPQKPRMDLLPQQVRGCLRARQTELVVERAVWLHYHVLELQ